MNTLKKVAFLTLALTQGVFYSQTKEGIKTEQLSNLPNGLVEKTFTDVGKVKDIKIVIMAVKNLNANTTKNVLRIEGETKSALTSETKIALIDYDEIEGLVKAMNSVNSSFSNVTKSGYTEISYETKKGFEVGCGFVLDKGSGSTTQVTKNEKVYITTKGKMFEGKVVNQDDNGSYIWKSITSTQTTEAKGKWKPYLQIEKLNTGSIISLSNDDFKALILLIEEAKTKMQ